jgi:hypothetical protein
MSDWPTTSSAVKPKSCCAPRFQLVTTPSSVVPMIASAELSTMAASRACSAAICVRPCRLRLSTPASAASRTLISVPISMTSLGESGCIRAMNGGCALNSICHLRPNTSRSRRCV